MSRAFVTDKEDWTYCPKAGERCMHAEPNKACSVTECEHFNKEAKASDLGASVKVVSREPKAAKAAQTAKSNRARKTKKANLEKPKKWGGRSGGFW